MRAKRLTLILLTLMFALIMGAAITNEDGELATVALLGVVVSQLALYSIRPRA